MRGQIPGPGLSLPLSLVPRRLLWRRSETRKQSTSERLPSPSPPSEGSPVSLDVRYLHIVCTTSLGLATIITVYEPKLPKWVTPFKRGGTR